ncbi:MAG: DUF2752 domain-containing protein [Lachnospiraceae bacterium]|nr:DUF2752 domain-containing protein [Lachnospiraceae bacterium]
MKGDLLPAAVADALENEMNVKDYERTIFLKKPEKKDIRTQRCFPKNSEPELYLLGLALAVLFVALGAGIYTGALASLITKFSEPCLFHRLTGLYCPGCGGTRAVYALFRGQIARACFYYPAVPYFAALYLIFMVTQTLEWSTKGKIPGLRYQNLYLYVGLLLLLGNWVVKNAVVILFHVQVMG